MKRINFSFWRSKNKTVSDDIESIQKQLDEAQMEARNASAEFQRWGTTYYGIMWDEAVEKVKLLEAKIAKQRTR
jgi:hypothetical protein